MIYVLFTGTKKGLSKTPCSRSHIFPLSLNKCSKSETYISSVKPASFCSLHWMWSLLLTKIHFKDFSWKGLQGLNVLVCPSVIPSQNKQLFYVKCLDLKTGDTVCVFIRDDVNILHKDDKKKKDCIKLIYVYFSLLACVEEAKRIILTQF